MCGRGISENVQTSFSVRLTIGYHWIQPQSILSNARILLLKYDKWMIFNDKPHFKNFEIFT